MAERKVLVWFRNDLRLHDNEMLTEAINRSDSILPVYFFDPRHSGQTAYHTEKTGPLRCRFLVESVMALRKAFQGYGGDLLVMHGRPEDLLPALVADHGIAEVYHHREVAPEETQVSSLAEDALWKAKVNLKHFIGHTLYNKEDLPFPIKDIPDNFGRFRKKTEREATVKDCFPVPEKISFISLENYGDLPALPEGLSHKHIPYGGEEASLQTLQDLVNIALDGGKVKKVFSRLSPWLALGCLSPRQVYWSLKNTGSQVFSQALMGLLWRDYYRFMFKKHGPNFFNFNGFLHENPYNPQPAVADIENWKSGNTGSLVIDAIMQQLNTLGNISYDSRALAALFFIQVIKADWTIGAAYYEETLLDYAPATNWGSWANLAGVGNEQPVKSAPDFHALLKNFELHEEAA